MSPFTYGESTSEYKVKQSVCCVDLYKYNDYSLRTQYNYLE